MSKTKTLRARLDDAKIIEQAVRVLAAELQREVTVSELIRELVKYVPEASKGIKKRFTETSEK